MIQARCRNQLLRPINTDVFPFAHRSGSWCSSEEAERYGRLSSTCQGACQRRSLENLSIFPAVKLI
jgi:hypothetical protein